MVNFKDGPCMGILMLKRAPKYLRAVINTKGELDALDQLEDTPNENEVVYVYKREGETGSVHICGRKNISGWYAMADYRWMPEVRGQELRNNETWQKWAEKQG